MSLPSRGAWIEILCFLCFPPMEKVAPLAGSVDRNYADPRLNEKDQVAPLAGSVDRNKLSAFIPICNSMVAPLAGSVDRNLPEVYAPAGEGRRSPRGERG